MKTEPQLQFARLHFQRDPERNLFFSKAEQMYVVAPPIEVLTPAPIQGLKRFLKNRAKSSRPGAQQTSVSSLFPLLPIVSALK